jgi:pyruvate,orthophosphate dikinase
MGKPCVAGVESAQIDEAARTLTVGDVVVREGDLITIDGAAGTLMLGALPLVSAELGEDFAAIASWADERRRLRVRANADTPEDARRARELGAEGIGLCRTEHMFMSAERLPVVREMILSTQDEQRAAALAELLPMQQSDFEAIFAAMAGLPVTVRLLDPPLHEFLPDRTALAVELALTEPGPERTRLERLAERVRQLSEQNPMLGTRGCRLALLYPDIYAMQVRAIVRGGLAAAARGEAAEIEIMIPLVAYAEELRRMRELVEEVVAEELERVGRTLAISIGTMIELPRAALRAAEIAEYADFFSFGTNDLTQTAYALSRDDAGKFLGAYQDLGILESDPFVSIDEAGIGELMRLAAQKGRSRRKELKLGICGEHGGDPRSVAFCASLDFDYVSCSPFRVPVARLAAAQAAIRAGVTLGRAGRAR